MATLSAATHTTQTNGPTPKTYPAASFPVRANKPTSSATLTTISTAPRKTSHLGSAFERQIRTIGAKTDRATAVELKEYSDKLLASKANLAI